MGTSESGTADLIFSTTNPFGGTIRLAKSDWTDHVVDGHPEMAGKEQEVQNAVENPDRIRESTLDAKVIYESEGTSVGLLRVIVRSDDPTGSLTGSDGDVASAFPRDIVNYPSPRVGKVIWSNPTPPPKPPEGGKP